MNTRVVHAHDTVVYSKRRRLKYVVTGVLASKARPSSNLPKKGLLLLGRPRDELKWTTDGGDGYKHEHERRHFILEADKRDK